MIKAPESQHLVPFDGSFRIADAPTEPTKDERSNTKDRLKDAINKIDKLQRALYAGDRHSLLLIFQGMDAAGKDSTIRAVMEGINPAGCQVFSFKKPSSSELDHDFLWRTTCSLPERGRIGIFNRSHYEEVLVVRVHPGIINSQQLPDAVDMKTIWDERFDSIRDHEKHLARNGTVILKFWLNVSMEEQKERLLSRLDEADKNWKFNPRDVVERRHWGDYMHAYEEALNATSRPWAPWYAIPADRKSYIRASIAEIVAGSLKNIDPQYPDPSTEDVAQFDSARQELSDAPGK